MEPRGSRERLPRWSIADWGLAAWTAAIVVAVIVVEVANAFWWTSSGWTGFLAFFILAMGLGLWFAGLVVFWTLREIGISLVETAHGLAHSMRSSRP